MSDVVRPFRYVLNILDLDDTLFKSEASVSVISKSDGTLIRKLNSMEYAGYKLQHDETFDFSEFRCADIFAATAKPIDKMLLKIKTFIHDPYAQTVIITARSDFNNNEKFLQVLQDHGISEDIKVYRAGNINIPTHKAKRVIIEEILYANKAAFDVVRMFDDSYKNLNEFLRLRNISYLTCEAYLVHEDGEITTYG